MMHKVCVCLCVHKSERISFNKVRDGIWPFSDADLKFPHWLAWWLECELFKFRICSADFIRWRLQNAELLHSTTIKLIEHWTWNLHERGGKWANHAMQQLVDCCFGVARLSSPHLGTCWCGASDDPSTPSSQHWRVQDVCLRWMVESRFVFCVNKILVSHRTLHSLSEELRQVWKNM